MSQDDLVVKYHLQNLSKTEQALFIEQLKSAQTNGWRVTL